MREIADKKNPTTRIEIRIHCIIPMIIAIATLTSVTILDLRTSSHFLFNKYFLLGCSVRGIVKSVTIANRLNIPRIQGEHKSIPNPNPTSRPAHITKKQR